MSRQLEEGQLPMWDYWKSKYGRSLALETYYPDALETPRMQVAVAQLKNAEAVIDAFMEEWEVEYEETDESISIRQ